MSSIRNFLITLRNGQEGQTAVEYVMMLAVVAVLATTFMKRVKGWVLAPCDVNPSSLNCMFEKFLGGTKFTYFTIRK